MIWLWHGFNLNQEMRRKQFYYTWHCLVCCLKTLIQIIRLAQSLEETTNV